MPRVENGSFRAARFARRVLTTTDAGRKETRDRSPRSNKTRTAPIVSADSKPRTPAQRQLANGSAGGALLTSGAVAANLNAGGRSGVDNGGMILASDYQDGDL